jgi:hypothetical protein
MSLGRQQRRILLGGALAAAVALVFGQGSPPSEPVVVAAVAPARVARAEPAPRLEVERMSRVAPAAAAADLFAPKSWNPVRQVPRAEAPPPPAPVAPPLPFEYVGQMEGREGLIAYLAREGEFLTVKAGDRIGDDYRVESIAADALVFVYVPLEQHQTLAAVKREEP